MSQVTTAAPKAPPDKKYASNELGVDRRTGLTQKELINEYIDPARPVILTDAVKDWPAMGKWTPDFFKKNYGHITFKEGGSGPDITLAEQIDRMKASTPENPAPYPCQLGFNNFPELLADVRPAVKWGPSDRTMHPLLPKAMLGGTVLHELLFGGRGAVFPYLHYDMLGLSTQLTQIYGDKEFYFFPPEQTEFLYPQKDSHRTSEIGNMFAPDLKKFPLFAKAKPIVTTLYQGETIYFPTRWWHATKIHGECITYGRAVLNHANWHNFMRENRDHWRRYHPKMATPGYVFGKALGGVMSALEVFNG